MSLQTELTTNLEHKRLHIVPTAMGLKPPPGLSKGVKGALATNSPKTIGQFPANYRLTTPAIDCSKSSATAAAAPLSASNKCWARSPSLPQAVPFGKLFKADKTSLESTVNDAAEIASEGMRGDGA